MKRLSLWLVFCGVLFCLFSAACSKSGQSDEALAGTIQQRLAADSALSGQQLHAEVHKGVAVLSGKVATPEQMQAAVKDTSTPGVQQIISQITVVPPLPPAPTIAQFTAEPNSIQRRQAATLNWQVAGETASVSIDQGVGTVQNSGNRRVQPNDSVTYTLTATGPGGTNTASAAITVANQPPPPPPPPPPPTITATAQPSEVRAGQSVDPELERHQYRVTHDQWGARSTKRFEAGIPFRVNCIHLCREKSRRQDGQLPVAGSGASGTGAGGPYITLASPRRASSPVKTPD